MINELSEKISNRLLRKKIIDNEEKEIYQYGMNQMLLSLINILTTLMIGILLGMLWQCVIFTFSFMVIRTYAGGYHASTQKRCYLLTASIIIATLSVIKYVEINNYICLILLSISSVIILMFSPVGSENKPLDDIEIVIYRKKTIIVWCVEFLIAIAFILVSMKEISICITLAQVDLALCLLSAKWKISKKNKNIGEI